MREEADVAEAISRSLRESSWETTSSPDRMDLDDGSLSAAGPSHRPHRETEDSRDYAMSQEERREQQEWLDFHYSRKLGSETSGVDAPPPSGGPGSSANDKGKRRAS